MTIERSRTDVTYEFFEHVDNDRRLRHALEILTSPDAKCIAGRVVIPSDEIGESAFPLNSQTHLNTPTPTVDPSRRRDSYERR